MRNSGKLRVFFSVQHLTRIRNLSRLFFLLSSFSEMEGGSESKKQPAFLFDLRTGRIGTAHGRHRQPEQMEMWRNQVEQHDGQFPPGEIPLSNMHDGQFDAYPWSHGQTFRNFEFRNLFRSGLWFGVSAFCRTRSGQFEELTLNRQHNKCPPCFHAAGMLV